MIKEEKYNLSEFKIFLYIKAHDYLINSLNCNKFKLNEGITKNKNIYNNILIDLIYKNIPQDIICQYPISTVFGIKQIRPGFIIDLTKLEKQNNLFLSDWKADDSYALNYWTEEYQIYKSVYSDYACNSYTHYIFKLLLKLLLTEVYLYRLNGHIWTYYELVTRYNAFILNHPNPQSVKPLDQKLSDREIEKIKYQCIKILEPSDINYQSLSHLKVKLIDTNIQGDFIKMYDSIIEKDLSSFWDFEQVIQNNLFIEKNKDINKKILS